jgi:hypothetical protein
VLGSFLFGNKWKRRELPVGLEEKPDKNGLSRVQVPKPPALRPFLFAIGRYPAKCFDLRRSCRTSIEEAAWAPRKERGRQLRRPYFSLGGGSVWPQRKHSKTSFSRPWFTRIMFIPHLGQAGRS